MRVMSELDPERERTALRSSIDAAIAGDSSAYQDLYDRYARRVKAFAMSRRSADADQLANDVMLRVFQKLGSFHGQDGQFESWVFAIARNALIDQHRATRRNPAVVELDYGTVEGLESTESTEDTAVENLDAHRIVHLLGLLTDDQRDVVELRIVVGLSLEQVSDTLGKPVGAVKSLQRRGLMRLQRILLDEAVSF